MTFRTILRKFKRFKGFRIFDSSPVGSEPFQNSVFVEEVVPVDAGELASKVDQGWHLVHPVLLCVPGHHNKEGEDNDDFLFFFTSHHSLWPWWCLERPFRRQSSQDLRLPRRILRSCPRLQTSFSSINCWILEITKLQYKVWCKDDVTLKTYKSRQPQTRFRRVASPKVFYSLLQSHLLSRTHPKNSEWIQNHR